MQQLKLEYEARIAPLRQELWAKKTQWRNLLAGGNADPAQAVGLQREMIALSDEIQREMTAMKRKMLDLVDPAQGN